MPASLALLLNEYDLSLSLPSLSLPQIDLTHIEAEWRRLISSIPEPWKLNNDGREFEVGEIMRKRGLTAHYPVVLVPGVISTALESWSTSPEYRDTFRRKIWGGFGMLSQVTFNREKWMAAIMLDPVTGIDPPGVKVRAAEGLDAASSFIQGYWVWSKIIENLAVVNYDTNNMQLAPYDWRLSMSNLEERDAYFSKLKSTIEGFKKKQSRKTVVVSHSMGSTVGFFLKWVESPQHGGSDAAWVENHIEAWISVAGTHLAKAMTAFLSGEMKDTVQMNPAGEYVLERFFSKKERRKLFRSWAGSASMWVKGGDAIWGNSTFAPDDEDGCAHSHGELIAFREGIDARNPPNPLAVPSNLTASQAGTWILEHTPTTFQRMMETNYSNGIERDYAQLVRNDLDHRKWTNPLEVRLPNAPSMKIFCIYGHGKETERSYWYKAGRYTHEEISADAAGVVCSGDADCGGQTPKPPLDMPFSRDNAIDKDFTNEDIIPKIRNGVKMGEGDGTVSLLSLGAMCVGGWKHARWNPAGIKITTVELPHQPIPTIPRGGANTSDHVDILGSSGLNEAIVKVVTGVGDEVESHYVSRIREYAARIDWDG
ncbi:phospholipid/diacylglycerol acyltransferase [Vararia minispora EC-137]|uniref:Phospholipid/diacylglycerol acyltransferase n=1 Tax=Vararia minispora EC-137 TaxID=1314806 RepID=A0ACB8QEA7_9AGAM|nr:phospholipid/diacylglycerol acyltransferase [Vararia minispora EC-137]